jgi:hypothetical protein
MKLKDFDLTIYDDEVDFSGPLPGFDEEEFEPVVDLPELLRNGEIQKFNDYVKTLRPGFYRAHLAWSELSCLDLRQATLNHAFLNGSDFTGSDLRGVDFTGSGLADVNLTRSDLRGADFTGCNLADANFTDTDLRETRGLTWDALVTATGLDSAKLPEYLANEKTPP